MSSKKLGEEIVFTQDFPPGTPPAEIEHRMVTTVLARYGEEVRLSQDASWRFGADATRVTLHMWRPERAS